MESTHVNRSPRQPASWQSLCRAALVVLLCTWAGVAAAQSDRAVATIGGVAPGTGGGTYYQLGDPAVNSSGEVVFWANILSSDGNSQSEGIFFADAAGVVTAEALLGQPAAYGLNNVWGSFGVSGGNRPAINDAGEIAFVGYLSNGSGATQGVFRVDAAGVLTAPLNWNQNVPDAPSYLDFSFFYNPAIGPDGEIAARARVETVLYGLYFADAAGVVSSIGLGGYTAAPAPLVGILEGFSDPVIAAGGAVAFTAGARVGVAATRALFVYDAGTTTVVVIEGDPASGTSGGTIGPMYSYPPSMNAAGEIAFHTTIDDGAPSYGIFVVGTNGEADAVVLDTDVVPGTGGGTFSSFTEPTINDNGDVAFASGVFGGVNTNQGAFVIGADGSVEHIAVAYGPAPDVGGGMYGGMRSAHMGSGNVVTMRASVIGGNTSEAIFVPEPTTSLGLASGAIVLWAMARRRSGRG